MLSITDLKKGTVIALDNQPYQVIEYQQKQMGRGGSIVNTKLKNLIDGSVLTKTFKGSEKIDEASVDKKDMQYLYVENGNMYFMDTDTYEQIPISDDLAGDSVNYMLEGSQAIVEFFNGKPIGIELPTKVTLSVAQTQPAVRGDTSKAAQKQAVLETGHELMVPLFVSQNDKVVVDTRTGNYVERA